MKNIYFATGNKGKLNEAREILGFEVKGLELKIDEIQSMEPIEVALKKARKYFEEVKSPLFIEDISFFIECLNGFPGTYIDSFLKTLGNKGITRLLKGFSNRKAMVQATLVYVDKRGKEHVFIGSVKGKVSDKPKGKGFGWDPIFIPEGEKRTFGEMTLEEKNRFSMRAKALKKLRKWFDNEGK